MGFANKIHSVLPSSLVQWWRGLTSEYNQPKHLWTRIVMNKMFKTIFINRKTKYTSAVIFYIMAVFIVQSVNDHFISLREADNNLHLIPHKSDPSWKPNPETQILQWFKKCLQTKVSEQTAHLRERRGSATCWLSAYSHTGLTWHSPSGSLLRCCN